MKWLWLCCHCWKVMNLFCNLDVQCEFGKCNWNLSLTADCLEAPRARPMCLSGKSILFLVKLSLSRDHVRFLTQRSQNMRSSWNNENQSWDLIFSPHRFCFPLLSVISERLSVTRGCGQARGRICHCSGRVGHSNMSASGRRSMDEQTEKCVRRHGTEKDQRWVLGPSIRNFQWLVAGCSHSHVTFQ